MDEREQARERMLKILKIYVPGKSCADNKEKDEPMLYK